MLFTPKRFTKLIAVFLTFLMLIGNPAVIAAANAADSANSTLANELPVLTVEKSAVNANQIVLNPDSSRLSTDQKTEQFLNQLIPYYLQNGKQHGPAWLRTTDLNLSFTEDYKPVFSLETIQPFSQTSKNNALLFWQGRYSYQSSANATANLGIGWRKLAEDKTSIVGLNAFYDYGFQRDLSRVGVGAEYFNKLAEYRANFYFPTSGDHLIEKSTSNDGTLYTYIRAVQGLDYEVGSSLANAPWLGFYASGFYYDNKHHDDEKGYRLRSTLQVSPRFSLEMGYTNSNLSNGDLYGKVQYQLADKLGPSLFGDSHKDKKTNDISHKLLQKVQRENEIKTETFTKFAAAAGSVSTTVINSSNHQPIQGAILQAYQNGNPVGNSVTTNAAGTGVISGLTVGEYTIKATYFGYSNDSTVTVQKDQTENTSISLAGTWGNIVVNVFDAHGASVSGATVTANVISEGHARSEGNLFDRILGVKTAFAAETVFTLSLTTGSDGTAHFNNLPPGNYRFTVQASGQSMNSIPASVPLNGGTSKVNVVLPSSNSTTGSAAITVTDGTLPVSGATASVTVNGTTQTATTNAAGVATFSDLPADSYTFSVSKEGYNSNAGIVAVTSGVTAAGTIALTRQISTVTITVTDGTNTVSGASVTLNGTTSATDEMGQVIFTSQPVGLTSYTVTIEGYDTKSGTITIVNGGSSETISIIRQTGTATITVMDGDTPLSGATVTIGGFANWTETTDASGHATFSNVPTGTYIFSATKAGYNTVDGIFDVHLNTTTSGTITVAQLGTATIIAKEGALPIQGAIISVSVNGVTRAEATNSSGQAQFLNLPIGNYTFTIYKEGYQLNTCGATFINGVATTTVLLTRQTGNATITVMNGEIALSDASVNVTVNGSAQTVTTNSSGQATFTNLPTGTYTFTATKSGYDNSTTSVTVANGTTATGNISMQLQAYGNVTIEVCDVIQMPRKNVTVSVNVNGTILSGVTDSYGRVTLMNIPVGTHNFYTNLTNKNITVLKNQTVSTTIQEGFD